jgi:hypothetical protein
VSCSTPPQSEPRVPAGLCNVRDLIIIIRSCSRVPEQHRRFAVSQKLVHQ